MTATEIHAQGATMSEREAGGQLSITSEQSERLQRVFPSVAERGGDADQLAQAAGLPVRVVNAALADPAMAALLAQAHKDAEADGTLLKPVATLATLAMLRTVNRAAEAGDLDIDDAANLLPKVHRVIEHAERMEIERNGGGARLPVFNITIGAGGAVTAVPADAAGADVVDVVATEVNEPSATGGAAGASDHSDGATTFLRGINVALFGESEHD